MIALASVMTLPVVQSLDLASLTGIQMLDAKLVIKWELFGIFIDFQVLSHNKISLVPLFESYINHLLLTFRVTEDGEVNAVLIAIGRCKN